MVRGWRERDGALPEFFLARSVGDALHPAGVWRPARRASGLECTPQDFRHSYVSNLSAVGIDVADLADITGHTVETAAALPPRPQAELRAGPPDHRLKRRGLILVA